MAFGAPGAVTELADTLNDMLGVGRDFAFAADRKDLDVNKEVRDNPAITTRGWLMVVLRVHLVLQAAPTGAPSPTAPAISSTFGMARAGVQSNQQREIFQAGFER